MCILLTNDLNEFSIFLPVSSVELSHDIGVEASKKEKKAREFYWMNVSSNVMLVSLNLVVYSAYMILIGFPNGRLACLVILASILLPSSTIQILFSLIFAMILVAKSFYRFIKMLSVFTYTLSFFCDL
jgi:hypothetical protein